MSKEYFTVRLSDSLQLGIPLSDMTTVTQLELKNICIVPGVADFWHGVINFQGSLLWVLDSQLYFDLDKTKERLTTKLTAIILRGKVAETHRKLALSVRQLEGIISVDRDKLKPISQSLSSKVQTVCQAQIEQPKSTYILNTTALFQKLQETSSLVTVKSQ